MVQVSLPLTLVAGLVCVGLIERATAEKAGPVERLWSASITLFIPVCWILGVYEQAARYIVGQRMFNHGEWFSKARSKS